VLLSSWKSTEELTFILKNMKCVVVFSCNVCANLNGTGGPEGLAIMKDLLKTLGKTIIDARTVNICCSEEIMKQTVRIYLEPVREKCDGLIMLSCAGGVKTAFLCNPGVPVVTALDSIGSGSISRQENLVAKSRCVACGNCVISYTGGICPVSECPAKKKYGPCSKAPVSGEKCGIDESRLCIWKEIEKIGDLSLLKELENIHKQNAFKRMSPVIKKSMPTPIKKFSGWFMTRIPGISKIVDLVN